MDPKNYENGEVKDAPNRKQIRFCQEYLVDLNAAQAAIRAGYSPASARIHAARMLTNANIQSKIAELNRARIATTKVNAEAVLKELQRIAFSDLAEVYDENGRPKLIHEISEDTRHAISAYELTAGRQRIKLWDKVRALELLGKHLSLLTDKIDHTSRDGTMTAQPQVIVVLPAKEGSDADVRSYGSDSEAFTHYETIDGRIVEKKSPEGLLISKERRSLEVYLSKIRNLP